MARAAAATLGLLALHTSLPPAAAGGTGLADAYYVVGAATTSGRYERLSVRCNSKPVYRQVGGGFALFDPAGRDTTWAIGEAAVATKCGNNANSEYLSYTRPPGPPATTPQVACLAPGFSDSQCRLAKSIRLAPNCPTPQYLVYHSLLLTPLSLHSH